MTENEIRQNVVNTAISYLGYNKQDGTYKKKPEFRLPFVLWKLKFRPFFCFIIMLSSSEKTQISHDDPTRPLLIRSLFPW